MTSQGVDATGRDTSDTIGVRELRAQVASVLRRAASGDTIVVTVDGRAVASLGPLVPTGSVRLADLVACGLIDPPQRPDRPAAPAPAMVPIDVSIDRVLDEVRR